jgi:hypothetical protein
MKHLRMDIVVRRANDPLEQSLVFVFCVTPIILVIAYLFYLIAERPFINHTKKVVVATVTEPPLTAVAKT